jgi:hypothetical protein
LTAIAAARHIRANERRKALTPKQIGERKKGTLLIVLCAIADQWIFEQKENQGNEEFKTQMIIGRTDASRRSPRPLGASELSLRSLRFLMFKNFRQRFSSAIIHLSERAGSFNSSFGTREVVVGPERDGERDALGCR